MGLDYNPGLAGFCLTETLAQIAFGTVITEIIPPYPGPSGQVPLIYALNNGQPNWWYQPALTHITSILYTTGTTAHNLIVARPLNWTTFGAAVAKNATAITLTDDPGVFSTNYRYPVPAQTVSNYGVANPQTGPAQVADVTIATGHYVCYQLADGTWQLDTIASGTFGGANLVLTTGTPNRTLGTIALGAPLFFFGVVSATPSSNPQTGRKHLNFLTIASANKAQQLGDYQAAGIPALNPGDPMMILSTNATATGQLDLVAGDYRRF